MQSVKFQKKKWGGGEQVNMSHVSQWNFVGMLHDLDNSWKTAGANQLSVGFAAN